MPDKVQGLSYANLDIRSIKTSQNIPKGNKNGKVVNFHRLLDNHGGNHGPILGPRFSYTELKRSKMKMIDQLTSN